jgi:AraC-like DNA-binding protein
MVTMTMDYAPARVSSGPQTRADHEFAVETVIASMRADVSYPYTLDTFAEMANYSPYHFARLFRDTVGIPPGEFLAALRFDRAKELILRTDASITDICFDIGFSSLGTFSARFKHLVGLSPNELRTMPEWLAPRLPALANPEREKPIGTGVAMDGQVTAPVPASGHLYIGLFPAAIPQSKPVSGTRTAGPGPFTLRDIPPGAYRLMAALFPVSNDPLVHLLPGSSLLVGVDPRPVVAIPNTRHRPLHIALRPLAPTDPPILTALAPMALSL